jgi:hypothetical protein
MFGKNYDSQISKLIEVTNKLTESNNSNVKVINDLKELFDSMQDNILQIAKIQNQHKAIISFLINHASVDVDAQEDLFKMLGQIKQVEEDVKEARKSTTKKVRKR